MNGYLMVFLGAGVGGALRHGVNLTAFRLLGSGLPYGTLFVNVVGSFVMGALIEWLALKAVHPAQLWRLFFTTGLLGGFTTFSTFSLDTAVLWERGQIGLAALYVIASVMTALLGLFGGFFIVRQLT